MAGRGMVELIALMFVSWPEPTLPKYSFGHCYQSPDAQWRPNTIGIHGVKGMHYKYRVWYGYDAGWSSDLDGKVFTIEYVYSKEIKCP
jgi:hypothetical protein